MQQGDSPRKRRRTGADARLCPHCGRTFKRTEHLERHVRTHTKEKPFACACGLAFTRRDLLTRHQRIAGHQDASVSPSAGDLGSNTWPPDADPSNGQAGPQSPFPQFMANDTVELDAQFQEFTSFLDGIGLPTEWSPYFPRDYEALDPALRWSRGGTATPGTRPGTPFSSWLPSAPTGNQVPDSAENGPRLDAQPHRVTDQVHAGLVACFEVFRDVLGPHAAFPSRHALTRYMTSFFDGFHPHMPFLHLPTWRLSDHSMELILGLAAIGAQYCFEHRASERLFYAGKAILMDRLARRRDSFGPRTMSLLGLGAVVANGHDDCNWEPMETVRALIALMAYATWEMKVSLLQEAFALQGLLAQVLRDIGLDEEPGTDDSWQTCIRREATRRAKLVAFAFLSTHSVAYNVYPVLRSNEVHLRLPCSTSEWNAATPQQWQKARQKANEPPQLLFQDALSLLLRNTGTAAPLNPIPTPLGNYVLLHGLLQRIYIVRDLSLPIADGQATLPSAEVDKLERGLRAWTSGWQQAPESTLDPHNESGPIPFTSSSLLGLAYVRIYLDLGPNRGLDTRDPVRVARAISTAPPVERSTGVVSALLYSAHMLSIPVRLGVDRVARSQAFFWSVRHSLSGLDCAILLSKWLSSAAATMADVPLTAGEEKILHWVRCIVEEAYAAIEFHDQEKTHHWDPAALSLAVLRIWAHFFESNTQWRFINMIGRGLSLYRDLLITHGGTFAA